MAKEKKIRVAFYIRVSTVEQKEGFSFEMQEKALIEHVKRCDYKGWETRKEWQVIEQASGADADRKGLKRLMDMAKNREFDLVLVWKIDRISRSLKDLLGIFETLNKYGVGFASLKEDIDFSGHIGKLIFQIFGALAEFERSTIQMRTEEGKKMSALAGNYIGGSPPFAYERVKNVDKKGSKLKLIKKEGEIVKQIFDWFVYSKKTMTEIAKELNKIGISKSKGARKNVKHTKWSDLTVRNILTNDLYRGIYIANRYQQVSKKPKRYIERDEKEWVDSKVEGVVNNVLFFQAQERLKYGEKGVRGGGQEMYMLKGKLVDMVTGKGFVGYKAGKGTKNYRRKKFTDENGKTFTTISISGKKVEDFVWSYVKTALNKPERFIELHKKNSKNAKERVSLEERYRIYREAHSKANERLNKVDRDYYDGGIDEKRRDELKKEYETERDDSFGKMKKTERELTALSQYAVACEDLRGVAKNMQGLDNLSYPEKANIVRMLVEKVEIHETKDERKAVVAFRFDQKAVSSSIPSGRTDLVEQKAKNTEKTTDNLSGGGR